MGLSRDQKRKAKLKKRAERSSKHEVLAYSGAKYKTDEFAPIFFQTELGIHESSVMSANALTDDDVEAAISQLVIRMREGSLPPLSETNELTVNAGNVNDLVITNIRRNWRILEAKGTLPGRDDLIGILRTILNSIDFWRSKSMHPQGYLRYIEGFMQKMGVSVQRMAPDATSLPGS